jgi:hypothetical protein
MSGVATTVCNCLRSSPSYVNAYPYVGLCGQPGGESSKSC